MQMKAWKITILAAMALSLSGCVVNEANFNKNRIIAQKHPELHAGALKQCESRIYYLPIEAKRWIGGYIHTDTKAVPSTLCRRLLKGYVSGRLQWIDLKTLLERKMFTPRMTQILRSG
jgi:hypothetical protein